MKRIAGAKPRLPMKTILTAGLVLSTLTASSQDTLPSFSAVIRSGKVIVSWVNPYENIVQITVQRSSDSLQGFRSILTIPDPRTPVNGYLDAKAPDTRQFYRLYVQLPGGRFYLTRSRRPFLDSSRTVRFELARNMKSGIRFTDGKSVEDSILLGVEPPPNLYKPSEFVFSDDEGNVSLAFPEAGRKKYRIQFQLPDGKPYLTLTNLKDPLLTLDKANFQKSGWYEFDVYEDDKFKERNKVFIPRGRQ
jgi:hypothetical protein